MRMSLGKANKGILAIYTFWRSEQESLKSVEYAVDPIAHELHSVVRSKIPFLGIALTSHGPGWTFPRRRLHWFIKGVNEAPAPAGLSIITAPFLHISASQDNGLVFSVIYYQLQLGCLSVRGKAK